jgi:hypothetical protein
MAIVFGMDLPVLEFLLILNVIMLFYVIISMFEIRSLVKLRKDLELILEDFKITGTPVRPIPTQPLQEASKSETYSAPETPK